MSEVNLEGVSVYPNPATDYVRISGVSDLQTVEVISITGKTCFNLLKTLLLQ